MVEQLDQQLFLFLNSLHSTFWDQVMVVISERVTWIPLYMAILVALWYRYRNKFWIIVLAIALAMGASDQVSVLIKKAVKRPRPCHEITLEGEVYTVNGRCGGAYGFVSSHATNSFSVALLTLLLLKKRWLTISMILWALVVGYSRIYLGVHYPGDVICGSLLGTLTGWGGYELFTLIDKKYPGRQQYFSSSGINK